MADLAHPLPGLWRRESGSPAELRGARAFGGAHRGVRDVQGVREVDRPDQRRAADSRSRRAGVDLDGSVGGRAGLPATRAGPGRTLVSTFSRAGECPWAARAAAARRATDSPACPATTRAARLRRDIRSAARSRPERWRRAAPTARRAR